MIEISDMAWHGNIIGVKCWLRDKRGRLNLDSDDVIDTVYVCGD